MSMKMAKRVSKSWSWGLNRSPLEIELLGHISDRRTQLHGVVGPSDTGSNGQPQPLSC
jgi:hypothetical protein